MYSRELSENLHEAHELMENIINTNKSIIDDGQLNVFKVMTLTLKEIRDKVDNQQSLDRQLLNDFGKALSISVKVFDGTRIDDLLWNINTELKKI